MATVPELQDVANLQLVMIRKVLPPMFKNMFPWSFCHTSRSQLGWSPPYSCIHNLQEGYLQSSRTNLHDSLSHVLPNPPLHELHHDYRSGPGPCRPGTEDLHRPDEHRGGCGCGAYACAVVPPPKDEPGRP
jgi:hypothetical protein